MYGVSALLARVRFQQAKGDWFVLVLRVEEELLGRRLRRRRRLAARIDGVGPVVFPSQPEFVPE